MTVLGLIELLQSYPPDMIVVTDCGLLETDDVVINYDLLTEDNLVVIEEYYNGDSANLHCKILNNVLKIE